MVINTILEFLTSETERLELHLANLELIQSEYTKEDQSQLYMNALENINGHSDKLKNEIAALKKQLEDLKYNPIDIAKLEFKQGVIPMEVRRLRPHEK